MDDARNRVSDHHHHHQHHQHHHHHHDHLGVNKMGRNIRKAPSQPQQQQQQQPQALVYNINKSDFRTIVQQLTGFGSNSTVTPPPENPPKPPNSRLVKVRPAPLTQVNRTPPVNPGPPTPKPVEPVIPHNPFQVNIAESPISAYIRYLTEPSPVQTQNPVQSLQTNPTFLPSPASQSPSSSGLFFPLLSPTWRTQ